MMRRLTLSAKILIAANLIALLVAFQQGWTPAHIIVLYWTETVLVGVFNVVRMLIAFKGKDIPADKYFGQFVAIPLFVVVFGFALGMYAFFLGLLHKFLSFGKKDVPGIPEVIGMKLPEEILTVIVILGASHGFSTIINFVLNGEYKKVFATDMIFRPFTRLMVIHVTICASMFLLFIAMILIGVLTGFKDDPHGIADSIITGSAVLIVCLKTVVDCVAHLKERELLSIARENRA